jgi:hypothetical protein
MHCEILFLSLLEQALLGGSWRSEHSLKVLVPPISVPTSGHLDYFVTHTIRLTTDL